MPTAQIRGPEITCEEIQSSRLRNSHLDSLASQYEDSGDKEAAKRIGRQRQAEATAKVWRQCAAARGLNKEGGLSHVLVPTVPGTNPKECNDWTRLDEPVELNAALRDWTQKH